MGNGLGVAFSFGMTSEELLELAALADRLGYEIIYLSDGDFDQYAALGACATVTERIRLASGITSVYNRNPVQLALAVATVDALSRGRFTLGIAAGHAESAALRDDTEPARPLAYDRVRQRLFETAGVIRAVLGAAGTGTPVHYEGEVFVVDGLITRLRPYRPDPPIHVGSLAPGAVRFAASFADGVIASMLPFTEADGFTAQIRRGGAGRQTTIEQVAYVPTFVSDDLSRARRAVEARLINYVARRVNYQRYLGRLGYEDVVSSVLERTAGGSLSSAIGTIPRELLNVMCAYGPAERCAEALAEWSKRGVLPIVSTGNDGLASNGDSGRAFADVRRNLADLAAAIA